MEWKISSGSAKTSGGMSIILLAFGLFWLNPMDRLETWRAAQYWERTPATITKVETVDRSKTPGFHLSSPLRIHYEYSYGGGRYTGVSRPGDSETLRVRDKISVLVNPKSPAKSTMTPGRYIKDALIGLFAIIAGLWLGWKALSKPAVEQGAAPPG